MSQISQKNALLEELTLAKQVTDLQLLDAQEIAADLGATDAEKPEVVAGVLQALATNLAAVRIRHVEIFGG